MWVKKTYEAARGIAHLRRLGRPTSRGENKKFSGEGKFVKVSHDHPTSE
jgi:hypothetical protein